MVDGRMTPARLACFGSSDKGVNGRSDVIGLTQPAAGIGPSGPFRNDLNCPGMTAERADSEADRFLNAHPDIEAIEVLQPDMLGVLRGKRLMPKGLGKLFGEGMRLPGSTCMLDAAGQNIPAIPYGGTDGDPDMFCKAVPGFLAPVPWSDRPLGQTLCSMYDDNGSPYFADPRHVLTRAYEPLRQRGLKATVAVELEFYLVDPRPDGQGRPRPAAPPGPGERPVTGQVYGLDELADFDAFLGDLDRACTEQGLEAEAAISEYSPGQFEVNLHHTDDPLRACDRAVLLKRAVKGVARQHRAVATFMAKPFPELTGNGQHLHVSLYDSDGRNALADPRNPAAQTPIGPSMLHAIAGLVHLMPESVALFAPNANSFRRFRPGYFAPTEAHWGINNRSVAIRIPPSGERDLRIEHRVAGADANTYLVAAALLAGINYGLETRREPPPPVEGNAEPGSGPPLPRRWDAALDLFAGSSALAESLGNKYCSVYHDARRWENEEHHADVPRLDYDLYLRTV